MNFGRITRALCINTAPPPDERCSDPAFALANPSKCPVEPSLVIKPSFALACALGSVQFTATYTVNGVETDVSASTVFQSSDPNVAVVGAASGNATGLTPGAVTITAAYLDQTAFSELTVLGEDCCEERTVAMMVVVDKTRSMGQAFGGSYNTKLVFAKAAATRFISEVNATKDLVGLMSFTETGFTVHSAPVADKAAVGAFVPAIAQTQQLTTFYDALSEAITQLDAVTADLKTILLISDGEDTDDSYSDTDNPIALLSNFKSQGGIVMCLGVRAHDFGYALLSALATGGFFLNAHATVTEATLDYLSGLKGYICAGNCTPEGDTFAASGTLNYCAFANWNVVDGHVDLLGNGFLDLLPGNGLYVDLAGSREAFKGRLESKDSFAVVEGNNYRLRLKLAGNQRVNASSNSVRARVFARNTDSIANPVNPPVVGAASGSGTGDLETYEYAYSYVNANGETELSPVASGDNGSLETFSISVTADASASATLVRFYKREAGTVLWYSVAESDPVAPAFTDTRNNTALAAAVADGTVDACQKPATVNTTATPIVLLDQTLSIEAFQQDFTFHNLNFTAPYDATVWISIQQTATPSGYDATGLLLDQVVFENATDLVTLLDNNFDTENVVYTPPACGLGSNYVLLEGNGYGYASGYNCYGEGCLTEPPAVQTADPNPLTDIEGGFTPPTEYTSTKTVCVSCPPGTTNAQAENLIPVMTSNTAPNGVASANAEVASSFAAWKAFNGLTWQDSSVDYWQPTNTGENSGWLAYEFPTAKTIASYKVFAGDAGVAPGDFTFEGSNNGTAWTVLDTRSGITWFSGESKLFTITAPASFLHYRLNISDISQSGDSDVRVYELEMFVGVSTQACATETRTSTTSQQNADQLATAAATAAAQAQLNCVSLFTSTQSALAGCPVGSPVLGVTRSATRTSLNSQQEADDLAYAAALALAEAALAADPYICAGSTNENGITWGDGSNGNPYPSVQYIAAAGIITKVVVNINDLGAFFEQDLKIVLIGPTGVAVKLMQESGGNNPFHALKDIVLDDAAASSMVNGTPLVSGSYKPTANGGGPTTPARAPAPQTVCALTLAAFIGTQKQGAWRLYVYNTLGGLEGFISGPWSLTIT